MKTSLRFALPALVGLVGCTSMAPYEPSPKESGEELTFEQFVARQKTDTGYIGGRAAELEIRATGRVRIPMPNATADELGTAEAQFWAGEALAQQESIARTISDQLRFGRNALSGQRFDLNLEGGEPTLTSVVAVEGGLEVEYELRLESLIKLRDLMGQPLEGLTGTRVDARLPLRLENLRQRAQGCFEDSSTGMPPAAEDLTDYNLFFYWKPDRAGCQLASEELAQAGFEVTSSSADSPTVYPEYDRLIEDGEITMSTVYGQMTHGELTDNDSSWWYYERFVSQWRDQGFESLGAIEGNLGEQLRKVVTSDDGRTLTITIDVYNARGFADSVPRDEANRRFQNAMRGKDIVFYGGHAFYGSLSMLENRESYTDGYQIFFMDSCWSYAYYTKQIFRNKTSAGDATGYLNADVVNNTEMASADAPSLILWDNILRGATTLFQGGDVSAYSWNAIIEYMNVRAEQGGRERPEIYGASGVRTNRFQPAVAGGNE